MSNLKVKSSSHSKLIWFADFYRGSGKFRNFVSFQICMSPGRNMSVLFTYITGRASTIWDPIFSCKKRCQFRCVDNNLRALKVCCYFWSFFECFLWCYFGHSYVIFSNLALECPFSQSQMCVLHLNRFLNKCWKTREANHLKMPIAIVG